jgi:hypothetical protein
MKKPVQLLSEAEALRDFPISGRTRGWYFRVNEISAGVYRVEGTDLRSRRVVRAGTDPELLLNECRVAATGINSSHMTEAQTHAWMFLSVSAHPAPLQDVIAAADSINHAIPTDRELQVSFGWLKAQGLVRREGKKYSLTEAGVALRQACSTKYMMATWDAVAARFAETAGLSAPADDVSPAEIGAAIKGYRKWFWATLKKLRGE